MNIWINFNPEISDRPESGNELISGAQISGIWSARG
jgi:hypothetical protein